MRKKNIKFLKCLIAVIQKQNLLWSTLEKVNFLDKETIHCRNKLFTDFYVKYTDTHQERKNQTKFVLFVFLLLSQHIDTHFLRQYIYIYIYMQINM